MKTIDTGAGRIGYLEFGAGPVADRARPLLMLHASAAGAGALRALAERLAQRRRVLVPDLDGYGATALDGPEDVVERHLRVVALLVDRLGLHDYDLFGHSMGGFLALQAAARGLIAPRRLALMEPVAFGVLSPDEPAQAAARALDRDVTRRFAAEAKAGRLEYGFAGFIDLWNDTPWAALPEKSRLRLLALAPQVLREAPRVSYDDTPADAYREIRCPVLLLQSSAAPAPMAALLPYLAAALPDARLELVAGCGHMGPVGTPEVFAPLLDRFLAGGTTPAHRGAPCVAAAPA